MHDFEVEGVGHQNGNRPSKRCERLTLSTSDWQAVERLALLYRVLSNPDQAGRLLDMAERIEAEDRALLDPVLA